MLKIFHKSWTLLDQKVNCNWSYQYWVVQDYLNWPLNNWAQLTKFNKRKPLYLRIVCWRRVLEEMSLYVSSDSLKRHQRKTASLKEQRNFATDEEKSAESSRPCNLYCSRNVQSKAMLSLWKNTLDMAYAIAQKMLIKIFVNTLRPCMEERVVYGFHHIVVMWRQGRHVGVPGKRKGLRGHDPN